MIRYPNKAKDLMKLAVSCMDDVDYAGAIRFAYDALAIERDQDKKQSIYYFIAECYTLEGAEEFAVETLAKVLSRNDEALQAYVLMIAALAHMQADASTIGYYIVQMAQIVARYGVKSDKELFLLCNKGGVQIDKQTFQSALSGDFPRRPRLQNADDRAREIIRIAREHILEHEYDNALETLHTIEFKGLSNAVKVEIFNDECLCYMVRGEIETVQNIVQTVLELDPNDVEALMVKYMLSMEHDEEDIARQCMERIGQVDSLTDEQMSKVYSMLSLDNKYQDIVTIADRQLGYCPDCYVYNKCKALALYNLGNVKACKKIFADMARLYPDMAGAEQYLYFLEQHAGDNNKITDECYLRPLHLEWQGLIDDVNSQNVLDEFGRVDKKLALAIRYLASREFDGDLQARSIKKLTDTGVYALEEYLYSLLIKYDVLPICKSDIIYRLALAGRKKFAIMQDLKFCIVRFMGKGRLDKYNLTCQKAYYRACSYAAFLGQKAIDQLGEALKVVCELAREKSVALRSANCLSAVLISYAFQRPIEALYPDVEYNIDTYLDYCHRLFDN